MRVLLPILVLAFASGCLRFSAPGVEKQERHVGPEVPAVRASHYRQRIRDVEVGWTIEEVHARLGDEPVMRPRRPDAPIQAPRAVVVWQSPQGAPMRLETYVTSVRRRDGCPDFTFEDVPIVYASGRVVSLDWDDIEWKWEAWGGDLAKLRAAQDRFTCLDD